MSTLLPAVDRAAPARRLRRLPGALVPRGAVRVGVDGWVDDDLAFAAPWGFDLAALDVPGHGLAGPRRTSWCRSPTASGWPRHRPVPSARLLPDDGHLSIVVGRAAEIVDDLLAAGLTGDADHRRVRPGAAPRRPAVRHPADLRPRARGAVLLGRVALGRARRASASSTCTPGRGPSGSRRCRAARRTCCSSSATAARSTSSRANIATVGLPGAVALGSDVTSLTSLAPPPRRGAPYDVVFLDPPYDRRRRRGRGRAAGLAGARLARRRCARGGGAGEPRRALALAARATTRATGTGGTARRRFGTVAPPVRRQPGPRAPRGASACARPSAPGPSTP